MRNWGAAWACCPICPATRFDVLVVGADRPVAATAVYAASEGLSVLALEQRAPMAARRAPAPHRKPPGLSYWHFRPRLAGRAYVQAQKFGVEIATPASAASLLCDGWPCASSLRRHPRARTVVLSCGARYRRPSGQPEDL
jgi:thioredoxin reductase (NADPH)